MYDFSPSPKRYFLFFLRSPVLVFSVACSVTCFTPYRPHSRCPRIPFTLGGWQKQRPFTSWSWNILGIHFLLSAYIAYLVEFSSTTKTEDIHPWLVHGTLIAWEVAAPVTLLVSAVVKYALWPEQIKKSGTGDVFLSPRALLQHNANVMMAVSEVALMGGLPVRSNHLAISVLYGSTYVLYSWAVMTSFHGQGPAFLYFFMDTTLGPELTVALVVLLLVLMVFYAIFVGIESLLHAVGNHVFGHAAVALTLCALTCRFRD